MLNGIKVYCAGPYTSPCPETNTEEAISIGDKLLTLGYVPFIPHLTHFWHERHEHDYSVWLAWCLEWVKVCDAVLRMPGDSEGADVEVELAQFLDIPVYYSIAALHQDHNDGLL